MALYNKKTLQVYKPYEQTVCSTENEKTEIAKIFMPCINNKLEHTISLLLCIFNHISYYIVTVEDS